MAGKIKRATQKFTHVATRCAQIPVERVTRGLRWLADQKRTFPSLFSKTLKLLVFAGVSTVVYTASPKGMPNPDWWPAVLPTFLSFDVAKSLVVSIISYIAVWYILRGMLPLIFFVPEALAMRALGLREASTEPNSMARLLRRYLPSHDGTSAIRVICISGKTFFRYADSGEGLLAEFVRNGKIEAIFPSSNPKNPTVMARHNSYTASFRAANYPTIEEIIHEMDLTKTMLRQNGNGTNKIFEHDITCFWRVILLSEHCLVQSYFPNHAGAHSDQSPVFVFEKQPECKYSYYETFDQMFKVVSGACS